MVTGGLIGYKVKRGRRKSEDKAVSERGKRERVGGDLAQGQNLD